MTSPAHHHGLVKWFNIKAGYGFIHDLHTGADVFCHASGLTRPLKDRSPREGDGVLLAVREGIKGQRRGTWRQSARRMDHRWLQGLIPLLLQHNGLPAVHIPLCALTANTSANTRLSRRGHPGNTGKTEDETVAAPNHQQEEAAPAGDEPKNREETETQDNVAGGEEEEEEEEDEETEDEDDEDDDEEDEEVDVLGSGSEGEAPLPQPGKPNQPSDPQPPSVKKEDNDGWVTKKKRRRRKSFLRLVLPKREQTTTPDIALRESPTNTRLRREKQTGKSGKTCSMAATSTKRIASWEPSKATRDSPATRATRTLKTSRLSDDETSSDGEEDDRSQHRERRPSVEHMTSEKPRLQPDNQAEDEGWVTKKKRQQKTKVADPAPLQTTKPTARPTTTPSAALRESSAIRRMQHENKSGLVCETVLNGYYYHGEERYIRTIAGYKENLKSYRYPSRRKYPKITQ
ncbi:hypothetical protein E2C01_032467 [Portunus trituberculatus]|uniref:CSD domain-containing protein n=1 Tax=Portunus trituberculatus TaxID=210409 RepID=A0A5B7F144_PORTR|nr:hypothetical protein [Portunus trituberculatus]